MGMEEPVLTSRSGLLLVLALDIVLARVREVFSPVGTIVMLETTGACVSSVKSHVICCFVLEGA